MADVAEVPQYTPGEDTKDVPRHGEGQRGECHSRLRR